MKQLSFWTFAALSFAYASLALGAEPVCLDLTDQAFENFDKILGGMAIVMASLKPVSWFLGTIADKTESKWDNKASEVISKILSYMGWFVGIFSIGNVPASVKHRPTLPFIDKKKEG